MMPASRSVGSSGTSTLRRMKNRAEFLRAAESVRLSPSDFAATRITGKDGAKAQRVMQAMLQMRKIDIAALDRAAAG